MKTFLKVVENTTWYRQFVYGAILAIFFGAVTIASGFHPFWAAVQIAIIAWAREDYMRDRIEDVYGFNTLPHRAFNWRNFFFLQVPCILFYYIYTAF